MYEEYFKKLKEECLIRNRAENTFDCYAFIIRTFLKWSNRKSPDDLTLNDARNYIFELRVKRHLSTQYCNTIHSSLKFFYRCVLRKPWDQDLVPRMTNDLSLPKVTELSNIERMIDVAREVRNKAIIALLYSSGLRVSELCRLAPQDIYLSTMQVHVRSGKNHCDHWTILSQKAADLLVEYWKSNPRKRDYLFVSLKAPYKPLSKNGVRCMIRKIGDEAGVPHAHPHLLRHSFASHMIEHDVSLPYVQSMMGHRHAESTQRYIHVSNKALMGIQSPLDHASKEGAVNAHD